MTSRRVFLGSVGSAVAVGVGSAVFTRTQAQTMTGDDVVAEILAQMKAHVQALAKDPKGEHLRAMAGALRLFAIHQRSSGMDARVTAALRARVRRDGEAEILALEPHWEEVRAQGKALGITIPIESSFPSYAQRKQVLDRLLRHGFAAEFTQTAAKMEAMAQVVDRRRGAISFVSLQGECYDICDTLQMLEWAMVGACLMGWLCPSCCIAATLTWYMWDITVFFAGCRC